MKQYAIEGMTCGGCVKAVTSALERAGFSATVDLVTNLATLEGTPDDANVLAAIDKAGFDAQVVQSS
jgi:Au+-exporting ATPase